MLAGGESQRWRHREPALTFFTGTRRGNMRRRNSTSYNRAYRDRRPCLEVIGSAMQASKLAYVSFSSFARDPCQT